MHSNQSFPSLLSSLFLCLPDHPIPHYLFRKDEASRRWQIDRTKIGYNKIRQRSSYQSWKKQPNRRKRVSKAGERHILPPLCILQEHWANSHSIYVEDLLQTTQSCEPKWALLSWVSGHYSLSNPHPRWLLQSFLPLFPGVLLSVMGWTELKPPV